MPCYRWLHALNLMTEISIKNFDCIGIAHARDSAWPLHQYQDVMRESCSIHIRLASVLSIVKYPMSLQYISRLGWRAWTKLDMQEFGVLDKVFGVPQSYHQPLRPPLLVVASELWETRHSLREQYNSKRIASRRFTERPKTTKQAKIRHIPFAISKACPPRKPRLAKRK